ncbi:hypothetical protein JW887_00525 [Candidatus Dojkabacteria bacterium]|nr:hypothetical protein [Candidatus Dojkabacteria bacterium]
MTNSIPTFPSSLERNFQRTVNNSLKNRDPDDSESDRGINDPSFLYQSYCYASEHIPSQSEFNNSKNPEVYIYSNIDQTFSAAIKFSLIGSSEGPRSMTEYFGTDIQDDVAIPESQENLDRKENPEEIMIGRLMRRYHFDMTRCDEPQSDSTGITVSVRNVDLGRNMAERQLYDKFYAREDPDTGDERNAPSFAEIDYLHNLFSQYGLRQTYIETSTKVSALLDIKLQLDLKMREITYSENCDLNEHQELMKDTAAVLGLLSLYSYQRSLAYEHMNTVRYCFDGFRGFSKRFFSRFLQRIPKRHLLVADYDTSGNLNSIISQSSVNQIGENQQLITDYSSWLYHSQRPDDEILSSAPYQISLPIEEPVVRYKKQ